MSVAVGVDAGASAVKVAVDENGSVVARASGDPANATVIGVDDAADAIVRAIRSALDGRRPDAIAIGAAGAGREAVASALTELIGAAFSHARVQVEDDVRIALRAAVPRGPGVVLVAGTGSVALGEGADGTAHRVGGAGYLLGDEGSAFWIGFAAVKAYARVLDGRAGRDETSDLVARHLDAPTRTELLDRIYDARLDVPRIAALAPSILAFAGKGNRVSTKIVQNASLELADLVKSAARAAGLLDASPAVVLAGGLLAENSLLSFLLETRITGDVPGSRIVRANATDDAAIGAVRLARRLLE